MNLLPGVKMTYLRCGIFGVLLTLAVTSSSFGVAGVGLHWGNDFTLRMEDTEKEWLSFDSLNIGTAGISGTLPSELTTAISGKDLPIFISRTDWKRSTVTV